MQNKQQTTTKRGNNLEENLILSSAKPATATIKMSFLHLGAAAASVFYVLCCWQHKNSATKYQLLVINYE